MSKNARSARGEIVDFDLIAIKKQLSTIPVPVGVNQRRRFIDEKDGIKTRDQVNNIVSPPKAPARSDLAEALILAAQGADTQAKTVAAPVTPAPTSPKI